MAAAPSVIDQRPFARLVSHISLTAAPPVIDQRHFDQLVSSGPVRTPGDSRCRPQHRLDQPPGRIHMLNWLTSRSPTGALDSNVEEAVRAGTAQSAGVDHSEPTQESGSTTQAETASSQTEWEDQPEEDLDLDTPTARPVNSVPGSKRRRQPRSEQEATASPNLRRSGRLNGGRQTPKSNARSAGKKKKTSSNPPKQHAGLVARTPVQPPRLKWARGREHPRCRPLFLEPRLLSPSQPIPNPGRATWILLA